MKGTPLQVNTTVRSKDYQLLEKQVDEITQGNAAPGVVYASFWEKIVYLTNEERFDFVNRMASFNDLHPHAPTWNRLALAEYYLFGGEYAKVIGIGESVYNYFATENDPGGMLAAHTVLGLSYRSLGQLDKAQDELQAGLSIATDAKPGGIYSYFQVIIYYQNGELQITLKNYEKAIALFERGLKETIAGIESGNIRYLTSSQFEIQGRFLSGLANAYAITGEWEKAVGYFHDALAISRNRENYLLESKIYADLGQYYLKKGEPEKALENQLLSLQIRVEHQLPIPAITNYVQLAELYYELGNNTEAIRYGNLAIENAEKINVAIKSCDAHEILAKIYERTGDLAKAYLHFKKFHQYNTDIYNQEVIRKVEQANTRHKVEMMQQEKEIFRLRNIELKAALDEIEESFRYAKRIQNAILPSEEHFRNFSGESFIFYRPKAIVAGDFYWLDQIGDQVIFAVCDCTGHGVPGAMVSVVCHNALNRSVREFGLRTPGEILNKTRELIIAQFEKSGDDVKDGMDCVVCVFDRATLELQYAAANNAFYIARGNELLSQPADKMPVGKFMEKPQPFTERTVQLRAGDVLFLFTDGYADQFGGPRGKKLGYRQFENLLLSTAKESAAVQKSRIEDFFEEWQGKMEQIDDVLVVGIKIK